MQVDCILRICPLGDHQADLTVPHPVHEDKRAIYSYRADSEAAVVTDRRMSYQLTPG